MCENAEVSSRVEFRANLFRFVSIGEKYRHRDAYVMIGIKMLNGEFKCIGHSSRSNVGIFARRFDEVEQREVDARIARSGSHFRKDSAVRKPSVGIASERLTRIFLPMLVDPFE